MRVISRAAEHMYLPAEDGRRIFADAKRHIIKKPPSASASSSRAKGRHFAGSRCAHFSSIGVSFPTRCRGLLPTVRLSSKRAVAPPIALHSSVIAAIQGNGILRIAADHWLVVARPNAKWLEEDSATGEYTIVATVAMWWIVRFYNITALSSLKAYWYPSLDSMSQSWMDLQADGNLPRRSYTSDQAALVALVAASKTIPTFKPAITDVHLATDPRTGGWYDHLLTRPLIGTCGMGTGYCQFHMATGVKLKASRPLFSERPTTRRYGAPHRTPTHRTAHNPQCMSVRLAPIAEHRSDTQRPSKHTQSQQFTGERTNAHDDDERLVHQEA